MSKKKMRVLLSSLLTVGLTLAGYFVIDAVFWAANPVEKYYPWGNEWIQTKMEKLDAYCEKYGGVDLLTVGSSVGAGIEVGEWQEASGGAVRCFNFNMPGILWANVEPFYREVILPKYKPKCVLFIADATDYATSVPLNHELQLALEMRRLAPKNPLEAVTVNVEPFSYIMSRNRNIRAFLAPVLKDVSAGDSQTTNREDVRPQDAKVFDQMGDEPLVDSFGAEHIVKWISQLNTEKYHNYGNKTEWSSIGFTRFSALSESFGTQFFWINQGRAQAIFDAAAPEFYHGYRNVVDKLTSSPEFVNAEALFVDSDFGDHLHLNTYGQEEMSRFLFNTIVSPQFLKSSVGIGASEVYPFVNPDNTIGPEFCATDEFENMPSSMQLVTDKPGASVTLGKVWGSGRYKVFIYSRNDNDKVDLGPVRHEVVLNTLGEAGEALSTQTLEIDRKHNYYGRATRTELALNLIQPARLRLTSVGIIPGERLILDSVSMRRTGLTLEDAQHTSFSQTLTRLPEGFCMVDASKGLSLGAKKP